MAPAPVPATIPIVNVSKGILVVNGDTLSPIHPIMLPKMQTILIPNLFAKAPKIGPSMALTPERSEPINDTLHIAELKSFTKGSRITPKEYPNPSEMIKIKFCFEIIKNISSTNPSLKNIGLELFAILKIIRV